MADEVILNPILTKVQNEIELPLSEASCIIAASDELVHASRDLDRFSKGEGQQPL